MMSRKRNNWLMAAQLFLLQGHYPSGHFSC
jgi:hypothetical protein